jgi:pimeloyl-[acyl-carrier protein] methyl ester esterase
MSLHVEVTGRGAPLIMLHGWGMHAGIWSDTVAQLAEGYQVHSVDLPGHGQSPWVGDQGSGIEGWVDALSAQFPEPIVVCGWSLGGIIAQRWAVREPNKVRSLILVNTTPCFAARADWDFGMPQDILAQFAAELETNHAATLRRFLALQVRGSEGERELHAMLRAKLFSRGEPSLEALRGGLEILRDADLRATLPQIQQPTLVIAGERDKLTPAEASHYLAQSLPNARAVVIGGAAHAPFLSHPRQFMVAVKDFLKAKNN